MWSPIIKIICCEGIFDVFEEVGHVPFNHIYAVIPRTLSKLNLAVGYDVLCYGPRSLAISGLELNLGIMDALAVPSNIT